MKIINVTLECTGTQFFRTCSAPNMERVGWHPSLSPGAASSPTFHAQAQGILPHCMHRKGDCWHNDIDWQNPYFLCAIKKRAELLLYTPSGWALPTIKHYIDSKFFEQVKKWFLDIENLATISMIEDFEARAKDLDNYYAWFWVMETHPPFYTPEYAGIDPWELKTPADAEATKRRRRESVEWADKAIIGRLMEQDYDMLVISADHDVWHRVCVCDGFSTPEDLTRMYDDFKDEDLVPGWELLVPFAVDCRDKSLMELWK